MNREDILKEVLSLKGKNFLFEMATGVGKSRIAIEKIKTFNIKTLLIVVPRNVLKQTWKNEINKWWKDNKLNISFTTYISFPKYVGKWDAIIYDECHHLSERCREVIPNFNCSHSLLLSATVNRELKKELSYCFNPLTQYKINLKEAIGDILPDPKVFLIPLELDNKIKSETIYKNKNANGKLITIDYSQRWNYKNVKTPLAIKCTEAQYNMDISNLIDWYKTKYMNTRNPIIKNIWLMKCNERLKWLSTRKTTIVYNILKKFKNKRTLVFCNSILQTEALGKYCINSQNRYASKYLQDFNDGKINHITACNVLNEGINLVNCQVGIYANINSSETIVAQRCGRLLRHPNPIIIIPYYKNTREEELMKKMLENYNPKLITTVSLNDYLNK